MRKISAILKGFAHLPKVSINAVLRGRRALILAPHADDESLGCGGFIAAACESGIPPFVIILTDGAASHLGSVQFPPARVREIREIEAHNAVRILGLPARSLMFLRFPDTELPNAPPAFDAAVTLIREIGAANKCELIVAPWAGDPHCDHVATARIAEAMAIRANLPLISYPVWGWLRNGADVFEEPRHGGWRLDITAHQHLKQQAIASHASQYGDLIPDSPDGFRLPADLLEIFSRPFEVFIA